MGETYYEVLGVDPDASIEVIERAYRERVLETHPDHNDAPDAAERFSRVTTAADVLTDETERARYDRLGHAGYVESAVGTGADGSPAESDSGGATGGTDPDWPTEEWWDRYASSDHDSPSEKSGPSHHARQRARRERRTRAGTGSGTGSTAGTGSPFGRRDQSEWDSDSARSTDSADRDESSDRRRAGRDPWTRGSTADPDRVAGVTGGNVGSRRRASASSRTARSSGTATRRARRRRGDARNGYVVSQWDDEVELPSPFRPLDGSTLVVGVGIAAIYPVLVYGTLTPIFPWPANLCVGACALAVIGYLLTTPRIAIGVFGGWSVLASSCLAIVQPVSPLSPLALGVLAGFWIPFGYALAVWWVLKH